MEGNTLANSIDLLKGYTEKFSRTDYMNNQHKIVHLLHAPFYKNEHN